MIKIYYQEELSNAIDYIKENAFKYDATIFGENTCNKIISDYNKFIYNMGKYPIESFWEHNFIRYTKERWLISNNIDIYFKSKQKFDSFMYDLYLSNKFELIINQYKSNNYIHKLTFTHYQSSVKITFRIGKSFTNDGTTINIYINYIYPINNHIKEIEEPPFKTAKFTCFSFIETKKGIRLSNNYRLDSLEEKRNIINNYTSFIKNVTKREYDIVEDFIKYFINNDIIWYIKDSPIDIIYQIYEETCGLCEGVVKQQKALVNNNCTYHCDCMVDFLEKQITKIKIKKTQLYFISPSGNELIFM